MAKPKLFQTATQDAKGFWWSEDADGNRYAVDPYSDEDFNGFRQVDRRFEETSTPQGAGLPMDSWRWKSGQVLTPQDMAQVSQVMSTPGAYVGVNGPMSVDQYLADPRSAVKVENGQYVYRPEQAQGDWESIDRESFMQSLGALPFVLGGFAAPYLSSLGVIGPGAGVMGSTGNMQFLGDVANAVGGASGAAGAAGAAAGGATTLPAELSNFTLAGPGTGIGGVGSANIGLNAAGLGLTPELVAAGGGAGAMGIGSGLGLTLPSTGSAINAAASSLALPSAAEFTQTFNLPTQSNLLSVPANEFTLANAGQGYGGVGTGGQGLSLGADSVGGVIGKTAANLATQGGVTLSDLATAGIGAGTGAGLGLQLPAGGAITNTAANLARAAGTTLPTNTGVGSGIGSGVNIATNAAGAASTIPQTASSALAQLLKDKLGIDASPGMLSLLGQGLGAGLGMLSSNKQTDALENLASQMTAQRAPFLNKATGYLNDPNSFYSSPEATGAASAVLRQLSATHGNPMGSPTAQSLATGALYDRYLNTVNSLGSLGLGGEGIQANLGQQVAQSQGQPWAIAGNAVSSLTGDNSMQNMLKKMFQQQFSLA